MKKIALILILVVAITACKNDDSDDQQQPEPGAVALNFINKVGNDILNLNTATYTNSSGEAYEVSELKYIISNMVLIDSEGNEFVYPQEDSYFVVNEANPASKGFSMNDIPPGTYTKIRFGIGVDQSNYPLNGVNNFIPTAEELGMLWSWSAGYKFLKFEGTFDSATQTDAPFILHIGSHGTNLDNYREVTLDLSGTNGIGVGSDAIPVVDIALDVAKIFDGVTTHALETKSDIQVDPVFAPILTDNLAAAFSTN